MAHKYSWLVRTKAHGLVQVDADRIECGVGGVFFLRHVPGSKDDMFVLCAFADGEWSSIEIMSQASGYGNGFTRIEDNKAKGRGKK